MELNEDFFDVAAVASADAGTDEDADDFECAAWGEELFDVSASASAGDFGWVAPAKAWENPEADDLTTGGCPSCGAEFFGGRAAIAMVCPCCGNARIVARRVSGLLKPECIIPFKRDKKAAESALAEFCEGKRLLPDGFMEAGRLKKSLQGIYAPFWLFDAQVEGSAWCQGVKFVTRGYGKNRHTEATFYSVEREGNLAFKNIPVDGSKKMDDEYMDAIEPFDYSQIVEFNPSCLAGCAAEKCDVGVEECKRRAESRMEETVRAEFMDTIFGYSRVTGEGSFVKVKNGRASLGLFPVWVLNVKHNGEDCLFMMNGQTGKFVGELPVDKGKAWKYRALFTVLSGPIVAGILYFFTLMALGMMGLGATGFGGPFQIPGFTWVIIPMSLIISALVGSGVVFFWERKMNTVRPDTGAFNYLVPESVKYTVMDDTYFHTSMWAGGEYLGIAADKIKALRRKCGLCREK
ncbi:MAG: hypothetical protein LBB74_05460 [Chitinispirillales bacterium]|jgi:hypothetical protein|nr:hypothetical protein [Chitinispirillales bacterium]